MNKAVFDDPFSGIHGRACTSLFSFIRCITERHTHSNVHAPHFEVDALPHSAKME